MNDDYQNRFYKRTINGKKGNLFTRVEALEEARRRNGSFDLTNVITSVAGGVVINEMETSPVSDGQYSGTTINGIAGDVLAFGNLVYLSAADSRWELADASAAATSAVKIGMCVLAAAADGDVTKVLIRGNVRADAVFPVMPVGGAMYASVTAEEISDTPPSANPGEIIRNIGHANTENELHFEPDNDFFEIGNPTAGAAGGNDTEVQYNDGGVLAGDANLTWDKTGQVLSINGEIQSLVGSGGLIIKGLTAVADDTPGGGLQMWSGAGTGNAKGGSSEVDGGLGGDTGDGGGVGISGGGGGVTSGDGGLVAINGGPAIGGGNGGDVTLMPGAGVGGGHTDGVVAIGDGGQSHYVKFDLSGRQTMIGDARINKTVILAQGIIGSGGASPSIAKVGNTAGYKYLVDDEVYCIPFEIPYDWDTTTDLLFKVHFYSTNTTASRFVKFQIDYNSTAEGTENVDAATTTTDTGDVTLYTTAYRLTEATKALPAANFAQDDVVSIKVKRIASVGTAPASPADNPVIMSFEIEYIANKLGEAL